MKTATCNHRAVMSFFAELKRRNVYKVGIAYLIVAWLIAQVSELALDSFAAPNWVIKTVLYLLLIGFPLALVLAWAFELTPQGLKREDQANRSQSATLPLHRKFNFAIFGLLLLVVVFLVLDNYIIDETIVPSTQNVVEPASLQEMTLPLPENPSIVVLPFDNMSGDQDQDYFADGITEDLTTDLSKLTGLFVIARNSAFAFKGKSVSHKQVAEELGVQYIVEGSVRRVGDQIRINAQFIDALSGHHVWADRYDGSLADIFTLQDNVVEQIVSALAISVPGTELARWSIGGTDNPEAYVAALQGWDHYHRQTSEDAGKSISFFKKAIDLDPSYSRVYSGLGRVYWDVARLGWYWDGAMTWQQSFDLAEESLLMAMREPTADAYSLSAEINVRIGRHADALADIDHAIAIGPSIADNNIVKARVLNAVGRAEEAEELVRHAMRLDPLFKPSYSRVLAHSLLHQERYQEATEYLEQTTSREKEMNPYDFVSLAIAYGYLGRLDDARAAVDKYQETFLGLDYSTPLTVQETEKWWYGDMFDYDKTYKERLLEGLREAGIPEGPAPVHGESDYRLLLSRNAEILAVEGAPTLDVETAKELWERKATFVDVRDKISFNDGHIPGAIQLDLHVDFTDENLSEVVDRNEKVVISCWGENCTYAAYACAIALTWGFDNVYHFPGGFDAWSAAGYPVEVIQRDP